MASSWRPLRDLDLRREYFGDGDLLRRGGEREGEDTGLRRRLLGDEAGLRDRERDLLGLRPSRRTLGERLRRSLLELR
jgi:hypothetical protein